jgi:hypothetical protein
MIGLHQWIAICSCGSSSAWQYVLGWQAPLRKRAASPLLRSDGGHSRNLLGVAALFGFNRVYRHYQSTCPTVADENAGRIYSLNEHDHIVYLSWSEQFSLISLALAAAVCFFSGYLLHRKIRKALVGPKHDNPPV